MSGEDLFQTLAAMTPAQRAFSVCVEGEDGVHFDTAGCRITNIEEGREQLDDNNQPKKPLNCIVIDSLI